jgi:REP element-mobilizing transposase RayT
MQVLPDRQSIRLKWFDYTASSVYFITLCTRKGEHFFGHIKDGHVHLSPAGNIAQGVWLSVPERFPGVQLDEFVFMPNHAHMILIIYNRTNVKNMPVRFQTYMQAMMKEHHPELKEPYKPTELWQVVRTFKGASTRLIRVSGVHPFGWHTRYWHEIIWEKGRLETLRNYIRNNPKNWDCDQLYKPPSV